MRVEAGTDAALIARMLELIAPRAERATIVAGQEPRVRSAETSGAGPPPPATARPSPADEPLPTALPAAAASLPTVVIWLPAPPAAPFQTPTDDDHAPPARSQADAGEAAFVLHVPAGAIEFRLSLIEGRVRAAVTMPAGDLANRALVARDDLIARLSRATGRPAVADVRIRPTTHVDLRA